MKSTYCVRKDVVCDDEGNPLMVYGVDCICSGQVIASVADLFFDFDKAGDFARLCNENNLEPIHLTDVAEDVLAEQYSL